MYKLCFDGSKLIIYKYIHNAQLCFDFFNFFISGGNAIFDTFEFTTNISLNQPIDGSIIQTCTTRDNFFFHLFSSN